MPNNLEEFQWKEVHESDEIKVLKFTGKPSISIDPSELKNSYNYSKVIFPSEVLETISMEINRYAEQVFDFRPEENGKRKHSPEWKKNNT